MALLDVLGHLRVGLSPSIGQPLGVLQGRLPRGAGEHLPYLRDVHDHVLRVTEQIEGFHELLSNVLIVNLTLVSVRQNDQTKKISA